MVHLPQQRSLSFFHQRLIGYYKNHNFYKFDDFALVDDNLEITPSSSGRKILEEDFYENIVNAFDSMDFSSSEIPVVVLEPEITDKDADLFLGAVKEIVSKDLTIVFGDKKWVLDSEKILNLVNLYKDEKDNRVKIGLKETSFDSDDYKNYLYNVGKSNSSTTLKM